MLTPPFRDDEAATFLMAALGALLTSGTNEIVLRAAATGACCAAAAATAGCGAGDLPTRRFLRMPLLTSAAALPSVDIPMTCWTSEHA